MKSKFLLLLVGLGGLVGCAPDISDPFKIDLGPAPALTVVSGAGQNVPLGSEAVVRVRLVDANGSPISGRGVRFHYLETIPNQIGGGTITFRDTNADGIAELRFATTRLGPFTVTAALPECATWAFKGCPNEVVRASAVVAGTVVPGG